ncbi:hypothetical protein ACOSP7_020071 [Xanthoceras sorbifolium]
MIPDVFKKGGPVNVRGRQVDISVESKNEYFGLEDVNHMGGHADDPVVTLYNEELVKDLQSRKGSWLSSRAVLTTEELHFDSALWNEFCLYSLFPNENGGMVSPDMAYVLYSIRHNLPINIGFLIRQQIADIGNSGLVTCDFPSLITHFYAAVGVDVYAGLESILSPSPRLDRGWYNVFAFERHEPELLLYGNQFNRRVRRRIDDVAVEGGHPALAVNDADIPWRASVTNYIDMRVDGLGRG